LAGLAQFPVGLWSDRIGWRKPFLVVALASVGTYFLHAHQVKRNAGVLLERARTLKAEGRRPQALQYYLRYLKFRPDDADALEETATEMEKTAESERSRKTVFLVFEKALSRDPNRKELRRRQVYRALALKRWGDAEVLRVWPSGMARTTMT